MIEGSFQVEYFDAKARKKCIAAREDTVDLDLESFDGASIGANITGVYTTIAPDSDSGVVLLLLVWFVFAYHFGVCDFSTAVGWDVFVVDDIKDLYTLDALFSASGILANALA